MRPSRCRWRLRRDRGAGGKPRCPIPRPTRPSRPSPPKLHHLGPRSWTRSNERHRPGSGRSEAAPSPWDFILRTDRRLRPERAPAGAGSPAVANRKGVEPKKAEGGADAELNWGLTCRVRWPMKPVLEVPRRSRLHGQLPNLGFDWLGFRPGSVGDRGIGRPLAEIPKVYQPRLDPDRSSNAQRNRADRRERASG